VQQPAAPERMFWQIDKEEACAKDLTALYTYCDGGFCNLNVPRVEMFATSG
jgi:hypothetical protein